MNTLTKTSLAVSVLALSSMSPLSYAEANDETQDKTKSKVISTGQWGLGINLEHSSIYTDQKNKYFVNLHLEYRGEKFNIDSNSISYSVYNTGQLNFEILGTTLHYGYEQDDSPILKGMKEREASLELGGRASLLTDYGLLSMHVLSDVLGEHKGQEIEIRFGEPFYTEEWTGDRNISVGLYSGLRWQSKDFVDYYYGVEASEATSTRAAYQAGSALIPFMGVTIKSRLSKHFSVKGGVMYEHRPSSITASPITPDSENELRANLGVSYWF